MKIENSLNYYPKIGNKFFLVTPRENKNRLYGIEMMEFEKDLQLIFNFIKR